MTIRRILAYVLGASLLVSLPAAAQQTKIYNTVKTKLQQGKQVIGGTVISNDPEVYCAMANAGFDYMWIEMQHSPLTYQEVAHMLRACKGSSAIPFIRVPDANEGDIQKATDIGALGIILPMVESLEKVKNAVKFAKYPPLGARSQGNGQYGVLWGADYRQTANDNMMVIAMIESPKGVDIAKQIADVPGVDVVFVASTDLGSFSGFKQGQPQYEALVKKIHDATLGANLKLGGPHAWLKRPDFTFFQAGSESGIIRAGVQSILAAEQNKKAPGAAEIEGSEKK